MTEDLQSLGLRSNPHILTYRIDDWLALPPERLAPESGDWGLWVARVPSGARKLRDYTQERHNTRTRIFTAALGDILFVNNYRIKTNRVKLMKWFRASSPLRQRG